MRVSRQWLRELVGTDQPAEELARRFTAHGLPVEEILRVADCFSDCIVAEVVSVQANSVTLFDGKDVADIAAPVAQLKADAKVALRVHERRLVLESEAGIEGSDAPVILPDASETGTSVRDGIDDEVLVVEAPPNRTDLNGVIGFARELACYLKSSGEQPKGFAVPEPMLSESDEPIGKYFRLEVRDTSDTPDYIARLVRGVRVARSPFWLAWRLIACGARPVNNVVDVTNYILYKYGQPLHGFDYCRLSGGMLITRRAASGEKITTIDGVERVLSEPVLVIADEHRPVAVAGIMGGAATEISDATCDVLIECARFAPAVIRRGARTIGLTTEASQRFEVGVDCGAMEAAAREAAALIAELCGGRVCAGTAEIRTAVPRHSIALSLESVNRLLGTSLSRAEMTDTLLRLGFDVTGTTDTVTVKVPSYRLDVEGAADLAEEVGRIAGYDRIPMVSEYRACHAGRVHKQSAQMAQLRQRLIGAGFNEVRTLSFVTEEMARRFDATGAVILPHPLNERFAALRTSLVPSLLEVTGTNLRRGNHDLRLFEIGTVYHQSVASGQPAYAELLRVAGVVAGRRQPLRWDEPPTLVDFYDIAGVVEMILDRRGRTGCDMIPTEMTGFLSGACAHVKFAGQHIGELGQIDPALADCFGITVPVFGFDLSFSVVAEHLCRPVQFEPLPRFPAVERDFAFLVDTSVPAAQVISVARAAVAPLAETVQVFDRYQGKSLPANKQGIGIRVTLRAEERTLTSAEIDGVAARLIAALHERLGAEIRK